MATALTAREEIVSGLLGELELFAELVDGLDERQWDLPSRCEGWQVRDIAAHVHGMVDDILTGRTGSRSSVDHCADFRDRTPQALASELRQATERVRPLVEALDDVAWTQASPIEGFDLGQAILLLWHEIYLHADDARQALGYPSVRSAGLDASVATVAHELVQRGWGPAQLNLIGAAPRSIGEGGPTISGDALQFVLAATGRADPAALGLDAGVNIYA